MEGAKEMNQDDSLRRRKEAYLMYLNEKVCEVAFEKVDGSLRRMRCTRNIGHIPASAIPRGESPEPANHPTFIPVFDVEKQEWRGFNVQQVIEFKADI